MKSSVGKVGKKAHRKGKVGEREFINTVLQLTDGQVQLHRNLDQSRNGGDDTGTHAYSIEIKRYRTVSQYQLRDWWQQCQQNAADQGKVPVLAFRADKQSWQVLMHPHCFFPEDDVRGCVRMDVALFCQYLMSPDSLFIQEPGHAPSNRCH